LGTAISAWLLEIAAANGNSYAVKMILVHGINIPDAKKNGLLCDAVENNHFELVKVLLNFGAKVGTGKLNVHRPINQTYNTNDNYPLRTAAKKGYAAIVSLLIAHGAAEYSGYGAALNDAATNGHLDIVRILLGNGCNSHKLLEAFHRAAGNGHLKIVEIMLPKITPGINIDCVLINAARNGRADVVELLLKRTAISNLNAALYYAVETGRADVVKILIAHGANARISVEAILMSPGLGRLWFSDCLKNDDPDFLLYLASMRGHVAVVEVLIAYGAEIGKSNNAMYLAAANGKTDVVRVLIAKFSGLNKSINMMLCLAATSGHESTVLLLLDNGADVHANNDEALRNATREEVAQILLSRGANVHANNNEALRRAVNCGNSNLVRLLLDHGADVHTDNDAALIATVLDKNSDDIIIRILLQNGANAHVNNDEPLRLAVINGRYDLVAQLLNNVVDFKREMLDEVLQLAAIRRNWQPNPYTNLLPQSILIDLPRRIQEYKDQHPEEVNNEPDSKRLRLH
jgi:ankyrin repeat protein